MRKNKRPRAQEQHNPSRREFLKWLAGTGFALSGGVSAGLLSSLIKSEPVAHAAGQGPLKQFLLLNLFGAPPTWLWNLNLKTRPDDPFLPNLMTANKILGFDSLRRANLTHAWTEQGVGERYLFPHIWSQSILTAAGRSATGSVPMASLLDSMTTIRTGGSGLDGHVVNNNFLVASNGSDATINGLIAESSTFPLPAVRLDAVGASGTNTFRSRNGVSAFPINPYDANAAKVLLSAFDYRTTSNGQKIRHPWRSTQPAVWDAVTAAVTGFQQAEAAARPSVAPIFENHRRAEELIAAKAYDFEAEFTGLQGKYNKLIRDNLRAQDMQGINASPVPGTLTLPFSVPGNIATPMGEPSLASRHLPGGLFGGIGVSDMRPDPDTFMLGQSPISTLATELAVSELALKHRLSSAIVISPDNILKATVPGVVAEGDVEAHYDAATNRTTFSLKAGVVPAPRDVGVPIDAHMVGALFTILFFSPYFRALSACLYELISVLKDFNDTNIYKDTLIEVGTDFIRSPISNLFGSDHGFYGGVFSMWSGRMSGTKVIGNIRSDRHPTSDPYGSYLGTWGEGAAHPELGGQSIRHGNILASIARVFGVPSPSTNTRAIFELDPATGGFRCLLPNGITVEEA